MDNIQEAFNNAMAQALGHRDVSDLLNAIPEELRLRGDVTRQEQINHAFALKQGFDSVQDLVAANGMNGTRGLKSRKF